MEISRVAEVLISQASLFKCTTKEAWDKYMHPLITNAFRYEDVKDYIDKNNM